MPISILDTEGKQWEFFIRCWPNPSSKTYVLEGLRDYIIAKKWQAGDIGNSLHTKVENSFSYAFLIMHV